jgi:glucuronoarabinoxylan endo-1,4-beta-xylanase
LRLKLERRCTAACTALGGAPILCFAQTLRRRSQRATGNVRTDLAHLRAWFGHRSERNIVLEARPADASDRPRSIDMSDIKPAPKTLRPFAILGGAALALSLGLGCGGSADNPAPPLGSENGAPVDMMPPAGNDPAAMPGGPEAPEQTPEVIGGDVGLMTPDPVEGGGSEQPPVEPPPEEPQPPVAVPAVDPPIDCAPLQNAGSPTDGDVNIDLGSEFQRISGFGGMNMPRWIADLTPAQIDTAFGRGEGQLGLSMMRIGISANPGDFATELPSAQRVSALGAKIVATPWSPPAALKTNGNIVGGELARENYGAYADHLMAFVQLMRDNAVPIEAISIQNEPDIQVEYDSCDWTPQQLIDFLIEQGPRFGDTRLMAPESFNFNRQRTDPLLNNPEAAAQFDIVAGHIYGSGLADYPLARQLGKEVWMTEHYTDSGPEPDRANQWPLALAVATELQQSMQANFNAYIWWYIRRGYGLITDDGLVSKRGYLMSQYSRFIRPGFVRVAASNPAGGAAQVTAYKNGPGKVVVVALNTSAQPQNIALDVFGSCVTGFDRFTTSQTKNTQNDGVVALENGRVAVTLDAQSLTTFVSQTPVP